MPRVYSSHTGLGTGTVRHRWIILVTLCVLVGLSDQCFRQNKNLERKQKREIARSDNSKLEREATTQRKILEQVRNEQRPRRATEMRQWCYSNCMGEWTPYQPCSHRCGGGQQTRTRNPLSHVMLSCLGIRNFNCPGSRRQTRPCNQACPRGSTLGGGRCRCQAGWTGTCCDREISCNKPNLPANVHMNVHTLPAKWGTVANFYCTQGYQLSGGRSWRCGDNGWVGTQMRCNAISCSMPAAIDPNLTILNAKSGYVLNELLYYHCADGYEIRGPVSRQCQESPHNATGRWTGFTPTCEAVSCPDPGTPTNGRRNGTTTKFGDIVTFSCNEGYKLVGSERIECVASKSWFGNIPTCEAIICKPLPAPEHGSVRIRSSGTGPQATFSCKDGYSLDGAMMLLCMDSGFWNGTEPVCEAVKCSDPGQPANGCKDGIVYRYPHNVTFSCHRGYALQGNETITCQNNQEWSGTVPQCIACPMNTYDGGSGICESCPADSHTLTEASTSLQQCVCDEGFTGVSGGECLRVRCTELTPPEFGNITSCDTLSGGFCNFTCNDGHVLEQGSAMRFCMPNGVWSGREPLCAPCAINTYKNSETTCMPCPKYSSTVSPGQMREGCICDIGFQGPPGGPCEVEQQCENITEDEAPRHGGLVCHQFNELNSIFCAVRCNPGYDHPARVASYETCGPMSNFQWTFQLNKKGRVSKLPPCVEAMFPDFRLEADSAYFTSNCHDLSANDTLVVKQEFANVLNAERVCVTRSTQYCEKGDMSVTCGRTSGRRKRDTGCDKGFWGENCEQQCDCVHGVCSPFDGSCTCDSGYEGDNCDTDIPGCRNSCFPGVRCTDIPAPGTGFTCGACPDGYQGDGVTCISDSLDVASLSVDLPIL